MSKTVVISGGSGEIGKNIAIAFGMKGYSVAVIYCKSKDKAQMLTNDLRENGIKSNAYMCDVSDFRTIDGVIEKINEDFGEITGLVNCAGIASYGLLCDITEESYRNLIDTDLGGAVFLSKAVLPYMRRKNKGFIINISSIWGLCGAAGEVLYSAAKAGLIGFTKALAKETFGNNIRVNCICPGAVESSMMSMFSEEEKNEIKKNTPLGRFCTGTDVARAALYLAESDFVTGEVLNVTGGMYM